MTNLEHTKHAVNLREVSKVYPGTPPVIALSDVTLTVNHGELLGIVGASGSGKSTLLHVLGTLTRPTAGSVFINGLDTDGLSDRQLSGVRSSYVGFVFQDFFLLPGISAMENVEQGLLYSGTSLTKRKKLAEQILDRVGLRHRAKHLANEMSGGEQQRVAIARALVHNPAFVLADEPTGNLDSNNTASIMELFKSLNDEGTTVILITHDLDIAAMCNRQVNLQDGKIQTDSLLEREGSIEY